MRSSLIVSLQAGSGKVNSRSVIPRRLDIADVENFRKWHTLALNDFGRLLVDPACTAVPSHHVLRSSESVEGSPAIAERRWASAEAGFAFLRKSPNDRHRFPPEKGGTWQTKVDSKIRNTMNNLPERDWKAFKAIREEMLETLCARINVKASKIINRKGMSQHEKYIKLYKHIRKSDKIVAKCFDDYRRSTLNLTLIKLREEKLLTDRHLENFSEATREFLEKIKIIRDFAKSDKEAPC